MCFCVDALLRWLLPVTIVPSVVVLLAVPAAIIGYVLCRRNTRKRAAHDKNPWYAEDEEMAQTLVPYDEHVEFSRSKYVL